MRDHLQCGAEPQGAGKAGANTRMSLSRLSALGNEAATAPSPPACRKSPLSGVTNSAFGRRSVSGATETLAGVGRGGAGSERAASSGTTKGSGIGTRQRG